MQVASLMMIITGKDDENLQKVLRRLQHHGLRAHKAKCEFFMEMFTYYVYDIDSNGLHKSAKNYKQA